MYHIDIKICKYCIVALIKKKLFMQTYIVQLYYFLECTFIDASVSCFEDLNQRYWYEIKTTGYKYLDGLLVHTFTRCTGGPEFDSQLENTKFSRDFFKENPS